MTRYWFPICLSIFVLFVVGYGVLMVFTATKSAWESANPIGLIDPRPRKPLTTEQMLVQQCPDVFGELAIHLQCRAEVEGLFQRQMYRTDI